MSMQDSKWVRLTDRKIGRLLCVLISLARLPGSRFRRRNRSEPPKRILLVEMFEMGAAVMMLPSLNYLKTQYPEAEVHVLTSTMCSQIWKALGAVPPERLHIIDAGSAARFILSAVKNLFSLRSRRFDLIIDYEPFIRISSVLIGLLKTRHRAGFHAYEMEGPRRGRIYDRWCSYNQNTHISKNYLALTKTAVTAAPDYPNFKERITNEEIILSAVRPKPPARNVRQALGLPTDQGTPPKYVVICPDVGKTLSVRNYPIPRFAEVARLFLKAYPAHSLVFVGTHHERETTRSILELLGNDPRGIDRVGKTSFDELLDLIGGAELVITNDNGPAHFATLTDTKVVALFSTDSPFVYGPLGRAVISYSFYHCSPCILAFNQKSSGCRDNKCLQAIPPDEVFSLIARTLEGKVRFNTINNEIPYLI